MATFRIASVEFFVHVKCESCNKDFGYKHTVSAQVPLVADNQLMGQILEKEITKGDVGHVACPKCQYTQSWMARDCIETWKKNGAWLTTTATITAGLTLLFTLSERSNPVWGLAIAGGGAVLALPLGLGIGLGLAHLCGTPNRRWLDAHSHQSPPPPRQPLISLVQEPIEGIEWVRTDGATAGFVTLGVILGFAIGVIAGPLVNAAGSANATKHKQPSPPTKEWRYEMNLPPN